jgi:hypothetical protein
MLVGKSFVDIFPSLRGFHSMYIRPFGSILFLPETLEYLGNKTCNKYRSVEIPTPITDQSRIKEPRV